MIVAVFDEADLFCDCLCSDDVVAGDHAHSDAREVAFLDCLRHFLPGVVPHTQHCKQDKIFFLQFIYSFTVFLSKVLVCWNLFEGKR